MEDKIENDVTPADLSASLAIVPVTKVPSQTKTVQSNTTTTSQEYKDIMRHMSDFKIDMRKDIKVRILKIYNIYGHFS